MSSDGKAFSSQVLVGNLKEIIRQSIEDSKKVTEPENPKLLELAKSSSHVRKCWSKKKYTNNEPAKKWKKLEERRRSNQQ